MPICDSHIISKRLKPVGREGGRKWGREGGGGGGGGRGDSVNHAFTSFQGIHRQLEDTDINLLS